MTLIESWVGGNGQPITTIYFDANSDAMLRGADGLLWRTRTRYDRKQQVLTLLYDVTGMLVNRVSQTDPNHLTLSPQKDLTTRFPVMRMTRIPLPDSYPLCSETSIG